MHPPIVSSKTRPNDQFLWKTKEKMRPILLKFANRQCLAGALVIGEKLLHGTLAIEEMDRMIHPHD